MNDLYRQKGRGPLQHRSSGHWGGGRGGVSGTPPSTFLGGIRRDVACRLYRVMLQQGSRALRFPFGRDVALIVWVRPTRDARHWYNAAAHKSTAAPGARIKAHLRQR